MDISKLLDKANEAASKRKFGLASDLCFQASTLDPNSPEAIRGAIDYGIRAADESGVSFFAKFSAMLKWVWLALMFKFKRWDSCIPLAINIVRVVPWKSVLFKLASSLENSGNNKAALSSFEVLRNRFGGTHIEGLRHLAQLYEADNQHEQAIASWQTIAKNHPGDRQAGSKLRDLSAVGVTRIIQKSQESAKTGSFARNVQTDKQRSEAEELQDIKTIEQMEIVVKSLVSKAEGGDKARTYEKIGDLYSRFSRYEQAIKAYNVALENSTQNLVLQFKKQDVELALEELNLRNSDFYKSVGRVSFTAFRTLLQNKLKSYAAREKEYPTDSSVKFKLGFTYLKMGEFESRDSFDENVNPNYEEAIKRFQSTFRDPKYKLESGLALATAFNAIGKNDLALKRLDETMAIEIPTGSEKWKELRYQKGCILAELNKTQEAKDVFLTIYELDVSYRDVGTKIEHPSSKFV